MSETNGTTANHATNGHAHAPEPVNPFPRGMGGRDRAPLLSERSVEAVLNALMARQQWFNNLLDPRRNLETECGYPPLDSTPSVDLFRQLYDREPIPNRVVQCMPKEAWQAQPLVYEDDSSKTSTPFEQGWDDLGQQLTPGGGMSWHQDEEGSPVWEHLLRGDILARIGRFGLIHLGVDDGKGLETPLEGVVAAPLLNRRVIPILAPDPKPGKPDNKKQVGVKLGRMVRNAAVQPIPDAFLRQEDEDWLLDDRSRQRQVWNVQEKRYDVVEGIPLTNEERHLIAGWTRERQLILNRDAGLDDSQAGVSVVPLQPVTHMPDAFGRLVPLDPPPTDNAGKYDGQRGEYWGNDDSDGPKQAGVPRSPAPPQQGGGAWDSPARMDGTSSQDPARRFDSQPDGGGREARQERLLDERTFDSAKDSSGRSPFTDWSKPEDGSSYLAGTDSQYYGVHFGPSQFPAGRAPGNKASESASWGAGGGDGDSPTSPTDGVPDAGAGDPTGDSGTAPGQQANPPHAHFGPNTAAEGYKAGDSSAPAASKPRQRLLFLACYDESLVQVVRWEWNIRNPRFRMPVMYRVTLTDPRDGATGVGLPYATVYVHWSRVIHLADTHANASSSETFAQPVIKPVLNRCLDVRKVSGAGAEGYWKSCFAGFSFETHPQLGGEVAIDKTALKDDWEAFINGLDRAMVTSGMEVKTLAPSVVDPTPHLASLLEHICIQIGVPKRVFMGSERGELASSQDDASWNDRVNQRRHGYVTPRIIVPFIDRLIQANILPEPEGYSVEWPDLDSTSEIDKAQIANTTMMALGAYAAGPLPDIIPPMDALTKVLGWDEEKAAAVLRNAAKVNAAKEAMSPAPGGGMDDGSGLADPSQPFGLGQDDGQQDQFDEMPPDEQGQPQQPFGLPADEQQPQHEDQEPLTNVFNPDELRDEQGRFASTSVVSDSDKRWGTEFNVAGKQFFFEAQQDEEGWHVGFGLSKNRGGNTAAMTHDSGVSPIEVLAHVGHSLDRFITAKQPDRLLFTAEKNEASRVVLYDRFTKKIGERYGYEAEMHDYPALKEYVLTRKAVANAELLANRAALAQWGAWFSAVGGSVNEAWRLVSNDGMPAEAKLRFAERLELARLDGVIANKKAFHRPKNYDKVKDLGHGRQLWAGANDWEAGWTWAWITTDQAAHGEPLEWVEVDHSKCPECKGNPGKSMHPKREKLCAAYGKEWTMRWAAKLGDMLTGNDSPAYAAAISSQEVALRVAQHGLPAGAPFTPDRAEAEEWVRNVQERDDKGRWITVYRGTGPEGVKTVRPSEDGVHGPGVYFYDDPQDAKAYAEPGGGIVVARVHSSNAQVHDQKTTDMMGQAKKYQVIVVPKAEHVEVLGVVPTEKTLSRKEVAEHVEKIVGKHTSNSWVIAELELPSSLLRNDMYTLNAKVDPRWISSLLVNEAGTVRVYAPLRNEFPPAKKDDAKQAPPPKGKDEPADKKQRPPQQAKPAAPPPPAPDPAAQVEGQHVAQLLGKGRGAQAAPDDGSVTDPELVAQATAQVQQMLAADPDSAQAAQAVVALHQGASQLAADAVSQLVAEQGQANAEAILSSLDASHPGAMAGVPGTVADSPHAKNLIAAIPLLALAEQAKQQGVLSPGSPLEASLTRVGSWVHAIEAALGGGDAAAGADDDEDTGNDDAEGDDQFDEDDFGVGDPDDEEDGDSDQQATSQADEEGSDEADQAAEAGGGQVGGSLEGDEAGIQARQAVIPPAMKRGLGQGKLVGNERDGWVVLNAGRPVMGPGYVNVGPDAFIFVDAEGRVVQS